jgi:DASS family divalent anion:Na+ symporter
MIHSKRSFKLLASVLVSIVIYALPVPNGLSEQAWHLFAIFLGTITLVMTGVFAMGAASLMGLTAALLCRLMSFQEAFSGFTSPITWLILSAFFISFGLVHTGLGRRIALWFVARFGKNILGLAYGIGITELLLAPGTPSSTARTGGIIYPVVDSIARSFNSLPHSKSAAKIGSYLILCLFNFSVVSSAMFMTAMAANPFAARLAQSNNIEVSWGSWALYALVPGIINLLLIPIILLKLVPPEIRDTSDAVNNAKQELETLGAMKSPERLMALGFVLLMLLWVLGPLIKLDAVVAALLGLSFLLIMNVVKWEQLLKLHSAFETFIWFGALLALAEGLTKSGFTSWFGELVAFHMGGLPMLLGVSLLVLVYFYAHYFFASCTAHVGALFSPFLMGAIALGALPLPTALALLYASSLFGSLTHYGIGPAPILFGAGYVTLGAWWRIGFLMSIATLIIWGISAPLWWAFLGVF